MARLTRLVVPGQAHLLVQRAQGSLPVFRDDGDRRDFLAALREASTAEAVVIHAYALGDDEVMLLATPRSEAALSRMVQSVGRRYVSAYNRRYEHRGTLWEGRYRCGVVEPGRWLLAALRLVDGHDGMTTAGHRSGIARDPLIVDPAEFWTLGNTPFDREAAYRLLLVQGLPAADAEALRHAAVGGWAIGSAEFLAQVGTQTPRPLRPRARGRPRKAP